MLKGLTLVGDIFLLLIYPPSSTVAKQSAEAAAKPAQACQEVTSRPTEGAAAGLIVNIASLAPTDNPSIWANRKKNYILCSQTW